MRAVLRRWVQAPTLLLWLVLGAPALAVQPDEVLPDPALEARAREISKELRCPVCRNESIDDSNAGVARDIRVFVRERLTEGDTDDQAIQAVVDRFGQFVRLKPEFSGLNVVLWFGPMVLFVLGVIASVLFLRSRRPAAPERLSAEEEAALRRLMDE